MNIPQQLETILYHCKILKSENSRTNSNEIIRYNQIASTICENLDSLSIWAKLPITFLDKKPNTESNVTTMSPLDIAIRYGEINLVSILIDKLTKSKTIISNFYSEYSLEYAAETGKIRLLQMLISSWIDWNDVINWRGISKFLTIEKMNSLLGVAQKSGHSTLVTFLNKMVNTGVMNKNLASILHLVRDYNVNNEQFEESANNYRRDMKCAEYIYKNCSKETLNELNNVIHKGIKNLDCGFSDSLLFLTNMIDHDKLTNTLEIVTEECLSNDTKNESNYSFFKNNFLNSNVWVLQHDVNKNSNNIGDYNYSDSKQQDETQSERIDNTLFGQIRDSVVSKELMKQKEYIRECVLKEHEENSIYWKHLKYSISDLNLAVDKVLMQNRVLVETNDSLLIDLMLGKGIEADYDKDELSFDNVNGFDGGKEYDFNGYLNKLLIQAYRVDPIFQSQCSLLFSNSYLSVPCVYTPAPVKTKQRSQMKADLDYSHREWVCCIVKFALKYFRCLYIVICVVFLFV